jgi:hypothetical protein
MQIEIQELLRIAAGAPLRTTALLQALQGSRSTSGACRENMLYLPGMLWKKTELFLWHCFAKSSAANG